MAGIASMVDLIFFVCSLSSLYYPAVCSRRDLILYTITVGKIATVQAPCHIYRRQNYKHNSNFIPKTFANLIEPNMWPLCMERNGGCARAGSTPLEEQARCTHVEKVPKGERGCACAESIPQGE